jgi:hypothetical protein
MSDKEPSYKKYWRDHKEEIMARRKLRPKAPLRPIDVEYVKKYNDIMAQIAELKAEAKKYSSEVRTMNRRKGEGLEVPDLTEAKN